MPRRVQAASFPWDFMRRGIWGFIQLLVFGALLGLLIALGYSLSDKSEFLTIMWPASGLLLVALWSSPTRSWIWILMTQLIVQIAIYVAYAGPINLRWGAVFAVANSVDAIVGAVVARRLITAPSMRQIRQVLQLIAAIALGAAVSAILGSFASIHTSVGTHFFRQWQLWWANSWLGSLFLAPVLLTWALQRPVPGDSSPPAAIRELVLIGCVLLGFTCWLFASPPAALSPILHPPVLLLALVIVAAFRLPPRWSTSFTALCVLIGAYFASRRLGPFAGDPNPFARIGALQLYLSTLIVIDFMLAVALVEMRDTVALLRRSEERYRNFVEKSSEAVWQVELDIPMPIELPLDAQVSWLRAHAFVAECNQTYRRLNHLFGVTDADIRAWRADVPWSAVYVDHFEQAARQSYSIDGLQFKVSHGTTDSTYLTAFSGVISEGMLVRLWGVARHHGTRRAQRQAENQAGAGADVCAPVGRRGGTRPALDRRRPA
jgi:integral membrane sensor domain MASE1